MSSAARAENGTPTPAMDDSPYIRFAIDQLTRDEELTGHGRHGSLATSADYPVERLVPDEGLGYYTNTTATNKIHKDDHTRNTHTNVKKEINDHTNNNDNDNDNDKMGSSPKTGILLAVDPPINAPLTFVPYVLRPVLLGPVILLTLGMAAALAFINIWSSRNDGMTAYVYFGGSEYFLFEFLPQIIGMLFVLWIFVLQAAVYRIAPLSGIARAQTARDTTFQRLSMLPRNFVLPDLSHFTYGEPVVGVCLLVFWCVDWFTVPLLSCLFQPRFYGTLQDGGFRWVSVQGVGWTLFSLYSILALALLALLARFGFGTSGLQWDPVSLADVIPFIQ